VLMEQKRTHVGTVIIADDEANIREGLKYICDWDELGFEIIDEAANGEEALDKILSENPSVVLMDLHMPRIHGIDVIKKAREEGFKGKFIILSGYSDFEYAKSAIKYGVTSYLTKPVDEDELIKTLEDIGDEIRKENEISGSLSKIKIRAKDVIVSKLLQGDRFDDESEMRDEAKSVGLDDDKYEVIIYETYHTDKNYSAYNLAELLTSMIDKESIEKVYINNKNVIVLKGAKAINGFESFVEHYEKRPLQEGSPLDSIFMAYGRIVDDPLQIHISYDDAQRLCDRRFYWPKNTHTIGKYEGAANDVSYIKISENKIMEYAGNISSLLQAGAATEVEMELSNACKYLNMANCKIGQMRLVLTDFFLKIRDEILSSYPECKDDFDGNAEIIEVIQNRFYMYEIIEYFEKTFAKILMRVRGRGGADVTMQDVTSYIDHNFDKGLTLEGVAPIFGYNSVYLGKVFNKTVGVSFNTYLNDKRIDEAKKLLDSSKLRIYEIAHKVGYNDVDYFSKKFRLKEGTSPASYRKHKTI